MEILYELYEHSDADLQHQTETCSQVCQSESNACSKHRNIKVIFRIHS